MLICLQLPIFFEIRPDGLGLLLPSEVSGKEKSGT
jgi:hypothetical protein